MSHVTLLRARSCARSRAHVTALVLPALALALAACGGGDSTSPPVPSQLQKTAGDASSAAVATATPAAPTVKVTDENGRPVRGVIVNFSASAGSLAAAVDTSDASGLATSGTWTLGAITGQQTVTATSPTITGVSATFTATATPGPVTKLVFITQPPISVGVGEQFQGPIVEIQDQFGNRTSSTLVVSLGAAGSGGPANLTGVTSVAAVDGRATFGQLSSTTAGLLQLIATATGVAPVISNSIAVAAGPASALVKVSGDIQLGDAGTNAFLPPIVKATDAGGNPVAGTIVTFSVVSGGGTIGTAQVATDADGLAKLSRWTLGPSAGTNVVRATSGTASTDFTATALTPAAYHIELRYINTPTRRQQQAFEAAWQKWRSIITGDIPSYPYNTANVCGLGFGFNETIDDMIIYVKLAPIDGRGQILGSAGPCAANPANLLPFVGDMTFDTADLADLESAGQLDQVITHEMGHVLGIGIQPIWEGKGLLKFASTDSVSFDGAAAKAVWQSLGGAAGTRVPVENCVGYTPDQCGGGTRDSHWREKTFNNELMTGFLNGGIANPLSALTIASLQDLGYTVNMSAAEAYSLPAAPATNGVSAAMVSTGTKRALIEREPTHGIMIPTGPGTAVSIEDWIAAHPRR